MEETIMTRDTQRPTSRDTGSGRGTLNSVFRRLIVLAILLVVLFTLYMADAQSATNGGTSFANTSITSTGAASWITVETNRISPQPGEQEIVQLTIDVSSEASPGQHIAGIVVQAESTGVDAADGEGTQFDVKVVRRAGVAVVIEVSGPSVVELSISDLKIRESYDDEPTVNDGNPWSDTWTPTTEPPRQR